MSSKKIITLDNLSAFKDKCDETYQPIGNYQPAGNYQPLDADLTAIAGLSGTSGLLKKTASNTWSLDTNTYATQTYVNTAISNLPEPMVFKGTLGDNGTITSLPTASSSNEGHTYKVTKDGTYASQEAKVGDVFVCANDGSTYSWILIPAGDDIEDTWRAIAINGTLSFSSAISSGTVDFQNGGNITIEKNGGSGIKFGVASGYSIPSTSNQSAWSAKYDKPSGGIPDSDIASASTWNAKQNALSTYPAHTTAVGSSSSIPVIKTNSYGQVTELTSVSVSIPSVDQTYDGTSTNAQSGTAVAGALENYLPLSGGTITGGNISVESDNSSNKNRATISITGVSIHSETSGVQSSQNATYGASTITYQKSLGGITSSYTLTFPQATGTIALKGEIPTVTTSVTSGSTDVITSGGVFTALGLNSGETGLIEATTNEINALFSTNS